MQGNCQGTAENLNLNDLPPRLSLLQRQCVLVTAVPLLSGSGDRVWLDGLYVRATWSRNTTRYKYGMLRFSAIKVWMTDVIMQGMLPRHGIDIAPNCDVCGVYVENGAGLYMRGAVLHC